MAQIHRRKQRFESFITCTKTIKKTFHQVYDNSEKTIQLLCELPEDMPSGKYKVSAFEKNVNVSKPKDDATEEEKQRYRERIAMWENYPFVPGLAKKIY